jgi:branched-chain amino acid transport system substrate-binding protein
MKVRPITSALALATAALTLSGCVSSSSDGGTDAAAAGNSSAGGGPVTIGVVMAKSGFMGPIDTPALNSMLLEADALNKAGGIDGRQIDLQVIDTETKLDRYASAAAELLAKNAKALIVTCDYDVSSPAALAAQAKNVLNVAPCVGDPIFGPSGGLNLGFSMGDGTPGEASIMAEFAHSKGWDNVVLLTDTTLKYTQNQCAIFAKRLTDLGGTVASRYDYAQGDSIKETVSKIAAGPAPQAVVNCGYVPGGATAAKELRDGGVTAPIISGFGMDGDYWTSGVPDLKDYYVVTYASKNGDDPDPAVNDAADAYQKAYGERPSVGGFVTGPTTLQAIKAAYESAGSWDGDKLTAAMEKFDKQPFLAGPTSFSPDLHIAVDRPMRVLQVVNGKLVFVEERTPDKVEFLQ